MHDRDNCTASGKTDERRLASISWFHCSSHIRLYTSRARANLAADGFRFDWGQNSLADKYPVTREPFTGIGSSFSVVVPPYTITNIIIQARP
jgi:hypothetical protein